MSNRPLMPLQRKVSEHGTAALEFALVLPTVLILVCGIATFGAALYSKQLLYDLAGETARACVMKNLGALDNVRACVPTMGNYLAVSGGIHQQVCMGQPVTVTAKKLDAPGGGATPTWQPVQERLYALQVVASCNWNYMPGFVGILVDPIKAIGTIQGIATMPYLYDASQPL